MKKHIKKSIDGFGNDGKFQAYYFTILHENNKQKQPQFTISELIVALKMAHKSFGYQEPVYEIQMGTKEVMDILNCSKPKAMKTLSNLRELKLIKRIEWQNFGPKQTYKYKVTLPKGYKIDLGSVLIEEEPSNKFF